MQAYQIVEQNMRHALQCFALGAASGEVRTMPGVLLSSAGVKSPVFNSACLTEPVNGGSETLDRRVAIAQVFFETRNLPWSFWLCHDLLSGPVSRVFDRVLRDRGLRFGNEMPGMFADRITPGDRPSPALECRRVTDLDTRLAFCHVGSVCFRLPYVISLAVYGTARAWQGGLAGWVGYSGGVPVAAAATLAAAEAVGVYSVATLPDYQRRGFAEALTRYALDDARRATGLERTVLQSTRHGRSLYRRLGYHEVTKISVYISS